jgi:GTP-binding protein EngB required for normal cell division
MSTKAPKKGGGIAGKVIAMISKVPSKFECPLSLEIMKDPVVAKDNHSYEREWIERHFQSPFASTSPATGVQGALSEQTLIANFALKRTIEEWLVQNAEVKMHLEELRQFADRAMSLPKTVPARFLCPLSGRLMRNPHTAEDGNDYDCQAIVGWIKEKERDGQIVSPTTGKPIGKKLTENKKLANEIATEAKRLREERLANGDAAASSEDVPIQSVAALNYIFSMLDPLAEMLPTLLEGLEAPRVVVLGNENSGKSTVLERMCMMPLFPKDKKICTRLPIRINIRRGVNQLPPTLEVLDTKTSRRIGDAKTISLVSGVVDVQKAMEEIILEQNQSITGVGLDRELCINITSPHLPPMNLLDLPGIVQAPAETAKQTRELASKYIGQHKESSMFLAVMDKPEPRQSTAIELVEQHKITSKTIGVLTKCDKFRGEDYEDEREDIHALLQNKGECLLKPHGYVATTNKTPKDLGDDASNRGRLLEQARMEDRFFEENHFGQSNPLLADRVGTSALMTRVCAMYIKNVRNSWVPTTLTKLREEQSRVRTEIKDLGYPAATGELTEEQVQQLREHAVKAVTAALDGLREDAMQPYVVYLFRETHDGVLALLSKDLTCALTEVSGKLSERYEGAIRTIRGIMQNDCDWWRNRVNTRAGLIDQKTFRLNRFPVFRAAVIKAVGDAGPKTTDPSFPIANIEKLMAEVFQLGSRWMELQRSGSFRYNDAPLQVTVKWAKEQEAVANLVLINIAEAMAFPCRETIHEIVAKVAASSFGGGPIKVMKAAVSKKRKCGKEPATEDASTSVYERESCAAERTVLSQKAGCLEQAIVKLLKLSTSLVGAEMHATVRDNSEGSTTCRFSYRDTSIDGSETVTFSHRDKAGAGSWSGFESAAYVDGYWVSGCWNKGCPQHEVRIMVNSTVAHVWVDGECAADLFSGIGEEAENSRGAPREKSPRLESCGVPFMVHA